ncbi:hypothetical protein MY1_0593 [Nitrosarchaeum koreense MY1]|uniref:Uncharacterized protein n=1 Tax=Nitrosarchaeum koreense MY1 TaxID=1001994 RepID=F9CVQ6_9ARCH|nr:hypothetical protein MY1_0593 [Nitrosarchaeum koreense MY1]
MSAGVPVNSGITSVSVVCEIASSGNSLKAIMTNRVAIKKTVPATKYRYFFTNQTIIA